MITVLSPCWRSILLTTTWHVWYTDEHVVTLLTEYTIILPGRHPHINFHVCVLHLIYSHHSIIIGKSVGHTFSASTIAFSLYHGGFVSWRLQEQELLRQQQRQCKSLVRMRKGVSQQQENINGMNANQRSNEVKNGRPIWRGMQRGAHVCQRSKGHAEGRASLSAERQSETRQTNQTGHAAGRTRLSEEQHAENGVHHLNLLLLNNFCSNFVFVITYHAARQIIERPCHLL